MTSSRATGAPGRSGSVGRPEGSPGGCVDIKGLLRSVRQGGGHRPSIPVLRLEAVDVLPVLPRQRDVIETVQQAVPDVGVDLERYIATRKGDRLTLEVDGRLAGLHQCAGLVLRQRHGQQPGLGAVAIEDVREGRRHHGLEAEVRQGPDRMLARRATAEVAAADQDRLRLDLEALLAPVVEEELTEARPLDALQELLRDDLVRVDVGAVDYLDRPADLQYRLHQICPFGFAPP